MASWLYLAIGAQFLFALSTLIDKHIVARATHIGRPIVYAFYVSVLSSFVIVLIPFGVRIPSASVFYLAGAYAFFFMLALYYLYSALSVARASDVAPVVGAVSAIVTILAAMFLLDNDVTIRHLVPLALLAGGTAVISHFHFKKDALRSTLISGICFGIAIFVTKLIFLETTFIDGFFWTRILNVIFAFALLLIPLARKPILHGGKASSRKAKWLVVGNKILGGFAAVLTAYAVSLGSVAIVNALAGLQFVFLFLFAVLFAPSMPLLSETKSGSHGGWHSATGVMLIVCGLAMLYLA